MFFCNGNHLLNYYDTSILLACFKITTENDDALVYFCWNLITPSYYQFVSTQAELILLLLQSLVN